jgi:phosphoribosylamine---glycine ligase
VPTFRNHKPWSHVARVDNFRHANYLSEEEFAKADSMKVLVIGGGGREHAIVWKLRESPRVEKIWCVPGNAGIAAEAECIHLDAGNVDAIVALAEKTHPDLTIVGPELPLVNGLTDAFRIRDWPIVGPSKQAAQLEGSKIFSKEFLLRHNIPTARMYGQFDNALDAYAALDSVNWPLVIKADGLCAGKGVFLAPDAVSAKDFIHRVMELQELGPSGKRLLLEETLVGEELSFIILTDGFRYASLVPTRDHKRVFDGDQGPNTGGMGAYSIDELLPHSLRAEIISAIVEPTLKGLAQDKIPYQGFLYIGLMLTASGPKVLEFNCRLGDPETQAIMARINFDLAEVLNDVAIGKLAPEKLTWKKDASACVVLASGGYPGKFEIGQRVDGITSVTNNSGVKILHAGTKFVGSEVLTSGGRVLGVTAIGPNLKSALNSAYAAISHISFQGMHFRKDIGASSRV